MLGGGDYLCIDLDQHLAVDGSVWLDGLRWLADAGTAAGELLDITMFVAVRTPGNPVRRHGPGWHLWCRADPEYCVRLGPLARCTAVEIKGRCTAPGSPGYEVRSAPGELPVIPRWVALLAGQPRPVAPVPPGTRGRPGRAWQRLSGAISDLYQPGALRNNALFKAACRARELIDTGGLDQGRAERSCWTPRIRSGWSATTARHAAWPPSAADSRQADGRRAGHRKRRAMRRERERRRSAPGQKPPQERRHRSLPRSRTSSTTSTGQPTFTAPAASRYLRDASTRLSKRTRRSAAGLQTSAPTSPLFTKCEKGTSPPAPF